jgi:putative zinc finger protein
VNCLDAETVAAWFDGGLSGAALDDVQSHVATCPRCQALVGAMGRTRAAVAQPQPERSPRWWLAWAVPAAAAATAVAIWVAIPQQTNVALNSPPAPSLQKQEASEAPPPSPPPPPAEAAPEPPRATAAAPSRQTRAKETAANDALQQSPGLLNEAVSVRPAAPAPAAAERRDEAGQQGAAAGQLQARAAFANNSCGPAWPVPPSDVTGLITAAASPSAAVCWMVGRRGTVLRSTDQRTWQRLNFSVTVDLTSVKATDAQSATVVTADGRTFSTVDGGVTWSQPQ